MADSSACATIVLIARNDVDLIGGAVASLLAQDGGPHPIHIIDDGSIDGSWERINEVLSRAGEHGHLVRTSRTPESMGPERLIRAIEDLDTPYAVIARPEDRSRPERMLRLRHVIERTGAAVIASNRTRVGGSVIEHAAAPGREGSGPIDAREIAFHLGGSSTPLGTLAIRTDAVRSFPTLSGPRLGEDLGPLFGFRGAILGGCYYLDETLVDFKQVREGAALDVRSRETCREGLFANLIASRTGMLQDLRDCRLGQDPGLEESGLVHLEASLKGVLIELVERWTQAREELWARDMRPCWISERELEESNTRAERLRPRSLLGRMKEALVRSRAA
jgi:hypothetical protein